MLPRFAAAPPSPVFFAVSTGTARPRWWPYRCCGCFPDTPIWRHRALAATSSRPPQLAVTTGLPDRLSGNSARLRLSSALCTSSNAPRRGTLGRTPRPLSRALPSSRHYLDILTSLSAPAPIATRFALGFLPTGPRAFDPCSTRHRRALLRLFGRRTSDCQLGADGRRFPVPGSDRGLVYCWTHPPRTSALVRRLLACVYPKEPRTLFRLLTVIDRPATAIAISTAHPQPRLVWRRSPHRLPSSAVVASASVAAAIAVDYAGRRFFLAALRCLLFSPIQTVLRILTKARPFSRPFLVRRYRYRCIVSVPSGRLTLQFAPLTVACPLFVNLL